MAKTTIILDQASLSENPTYSTTMSASEIAEAIANDEIVFLYAINRDNNILAERVMCYPKEIDGETYKFVNLSNGDYIYVNEDKSVDDGEQPVPPPIG